MSLWWRRTTKEAAAFLLRVMKPAGVHILSDSLSWWRLRNCWGWSSVHQSFQNMSPSLQSLNFTSLDTTIDRPHAPLLSDDVQIEKQCFPQKGRNKFMYDLCRIYKKEQIIKNLSLRHFTKFIKFLLRQQLTKLRDFLRESGVVLSLLISLLSLTWRMLLFQSAVVKLLDISYPGCSISTNKHLLQHHHITDLQPPCWLLVLNPDDDLYLNQPPQR